MDMCFFFAKNEQNNSQHNVLFFDDTNKKMIRKVFLSHQILIIREKEVPENCDHYQPIIEFQCLQIWKKFVQILLLLLFDDIMR